MVKSICCQCFRVHVEDIKKLEESLRQEGFKDAPQIVKENQVIGLVKKLNRIWQIHIRVYLNGEIKAEIEPRWIYLEHLITPSYSAHSHVLELLKKYSIGFKQKNPTPIECIYPNIKIPITLTDWRNVGEKFFVKLFVKRLLKKQKIHVGSLEDLKMFFLNLIETVNSFTTVNLKEFVTFKLEAGKLEMKVKCPILRGCGEFDRRLCEKKCFPIMCSILKILNRRIKLERHLPLNLRYSEECVYRFFYVTC